MLATDEHDYDCECDECKFTAYQKKLDADDERHEAEWRGVEL